MSDVKEKIDYKVSGYFNRWSVIATMNGYALLENSTYGDETCYLVVRIKDNVKDKKYKNMANGNTFVAPTIMEVAGETYDGLEIALGDLGLI